MYECVCVCICTRVCVCLYVSVYGCRCISLGANAYVHVYVCVYVFMCACVMCAFVCLCVYVCRYACMCVCHTISVCKMQIGREGSNSVCVFSDASRPHEARCRHPGNSAAACGRNSGSHFGLGLIGFRVSGSGDCTSPDAKTGFGLRAFRV